MDKQKISACKTLEVIWTRNSTRGMTLLPEMKEINIEDTVVKVKKLSTFNANGVERANRRVKRSLFQEKEKEKFSNTNKPNKKNHELGNNITSLKKMSDSFSGACQISRARSPQIVSNREKLEKNNDTLFRHLKPRLFPTENLKTVEFSPLHRNNTHNNYATSLKERPNSLFNVSQISSRKSPQISSNREKLERNHDTSFRNLDHNLLPTERVRANELSTLHTNNSTHGLKLLPEMKEINIDDGILNVKNSSKSDNSLHGIKTNENSVKFTDKCVKRSLFQENEKISDTNKSKKRQREPYNYVINVRKSSTDLSDTSKMSRPRSPQIISNREKLERNQNTLFNNLETHIFPIESSKTVDLSSSYKNSTHKNCITSLKKRCDSLSEVSQMSCQKSPQISSNREKLERNHDTSFRSLDQANKLSTLHKNNITRGLKLLSEMKEINIDDSVLNVKNSSKSDNSIHDSKMNENSVKFTNKCVRRSLFQENKNISATNKSKQRQREPYNYVINVRRSSTDLSDTSKISHRKSPQIVSNREKLERNHTSLHNLDIHLDSDTSIIKASYIADKISPLGIRDIRGSKSPEIMSNRKRTIEHKNFNKIYASNYDKCKMNDNCTIQAANKNFENKNTLSKEQLKINSVDSEDIIESSEVIVPQKMRKSKKNKIHRNKKKKKKDCTDESQILHQNKHKNKIEIVKANESDLCREINDDSLDIINTENILKSPIIELKIKKNRKKPKLETLENQNLEELFKINDDIKKYQIDTVAASSSGFEEFAGEKIEDNLEMFKPQKSLKQNTNKNLSFIHSEVSVILATPEHDVEIVDNLAAEYSSETILQKRSYVPIIEVDQSPKTQHINDVLIQSVQSPTNATILPTLFEYLRSPTPTISDNSELPFKIDSAESPCTVNKTKNFISPEMPRKKLDNSPSPNHFDSAKKRKKVCKNGLRGKFRELINRKKSETRIREYEKDLSKNYQPKQCESTLLNIIEVWKEFQTFILLCYHMKSDTTGVQKVLVTLDSCPKNATKNSIIRIYSPWLTVESKTTGILLYVGVIHADVIEFAGSTKPFGPTQGLSTNFNELSTTVFHSETIWKCNCSEEVACQCLGEQSVYNYLQYMISH